MRQDLRLLRIGFLESELSGRECNAFLSYPYLSDGSLPHRQFRKPELFGIPELFVHCRIGSKKSPGGNGLIFLIFQGPSNIFRRSNMTLVQDTHIETLLFDI